MRSIILPTVILAASLLSPGVWASTTEVRDGAGYFSADAVAKANTELRQIAQTASCDFVVETMAEIPAEKKDQYNAEQRAQFFSALAQERAKAGRINGLYVLICKQPSYLQLAESGPKGRRDYFSAATNEQIRRVLLEGFKAKQYDEALLKAVSAAREGVAAAASSNVPVERDSAPAAAAKPPAASTGSTILLFVFIIFGAFLGIMLLRAIMGGFSGGAGYAGGGGGGFFSGLLGGLAGAVAGNWLYNSFTGHSDSGSAHAGDTHSSSTDSSSWETSDAGGGGFDSGGSDSSGGGDSGGGGGDF